MKSHRPIWTKLLPFNYLNFANIYSPYLPPINYSVANSSKRRPLKQQSLIGFGLLRLFLNQLCIKLQMSQEQLEIQLLQRTHRKIQALDPDVNKSNTNSKEVTLAVTLQTYFISHCRKLELFETIARTLLIVGLEFSNCVSKQCLSAC